MQTPPIRLDLFALAMLLGVAQGIFIGVFFLTGSRSTGSRARNVANRCLGGQMLALSAICCEIFLNYTNYTFRMLWTVDLAEPFNFVLGPLLYFFVVGRLACRLPRGWGWHLLPAGIWTLNALTWIVQPTTFKYNSYIDSWHPELQPIPSRAYLPEDFTHLRPYINELTVVSVGIYAGLTLWFLHRTMRERPELRGSAALRPVWILSGLFAIVPVLVLLVKPNFYRDLGDYLLATYITFSIYAISFLVMQGSDFFREVPQTSPVTADNAPAEPRRKYEKSALSDEMGEAVLARLTRLTDHEKVYLETDLSLPRLASRLQTSPHHLSQLLNDRLGMTFFDWLATHRVAEAQRLLRDPGTANLKIDEIVERVGYNSPSAFHTAFKRLTHQTPAQFRDQLNRSVITPPDPASSRSA